MKQKVNNKKPEISRRDFIRASAAASLAAATFDSSRVFAAGSDKLRVGLIGCGGRGTGAAKDCVESSDNVEIVAMGDVFSDRLDKSLANLSREIDDKVTVTEDASFKGFDAYKKVLECDIDMVILAAPPHFRPVQLKAAIEAGKHVFMEKPVAVDPVGVRSVIASSELAEQKVKAASQNWKKRMALGWSDMEWQCRTWLFFTWLSGDHIVEQHVHNLDVINWAIGAHPVQCLGMGGREVRTGPEFGNVFDHF
ncbi:MAG: Gfo/Idh/MocA family protein, partial [Planctomycetota bacterium]